MFFTVEGLPQATDEERSRKGTCCFASVRRFELAIAAVGVVIKNRSLFQPLDIYAIKLQID
jgi:hypothetical protein